MKTKQSRVEKSIYLSLCDVMWCEALSFLYALWCFLLPHVPRGKTSFAIPQAVFLRWCTGVWNGMHDRFKKMQLVLTHLTRILFSLKIYSRFSDKKRKINRQSFHNFLPFFSLCLIKNYNLIKTEKREKRNSNSSTAQQHSSKSSWNF